MIQFREWLLREMGHIEVPYGMVDGKRVVDVDLMSEKYPEDRAHLFRPSPYSPAFYGRVPGENMYFVYRNHEDGSYGEFSPQKPGEGTPLPDDWWDYAKVVFEDDTVKMPSKP